MDRQNTEVCHQNEPMRESRVSMTHCCTSRYGCLDMRRTRKYLLRLWYVATGFPSGSSSFRSWQNVRLYLNIQNKGTLPLIGLFGLSTDSICHLYLGSVSPFWRVESDQWHEYMKMGTTYFAALPSLVQNSPAGLNC